MFDWNKKVFNMYFLYLEELGIYFQQDGFLDKELIIVVNLDWLNWFIN